MLPEFKINVCNTFKREFEDIYFTVRQHKKNPIGWLCKLDQNGYITIIKEFKGVADIKISPNGNLFLSISSDGKIIEIDKNGNELKSWFTKKRKNENFLLPTTHNHHTLNFMPNGNFLILDAENRFINDWGGEKTANVVGDILKEISRNGELINEYKLLDILDPYRIEKNSKDNYWNGKGFINSFDWSHTNSFCYDEYDDSFIATLRHQDCVIKIDRSSGTLKWILSHNKNWSSRFSEFILDSDDYSYCPHDCYVTGPNKFLCFDNGNSRPTKEKYSRAIEFEVINNRAKKIWEYKTNIFSCFQGGVRRLPTTENTFITYGGICYENEIAVDNYDAEICFARLIEVTKEDEIVFDMEISSKESSYCVFRSDIQLNINKENY